MIGKSIKETVRSFLEKINVRKEFYEFDFAVLHTMMTLSAVDGTIGDDEIALFKNIAKTCRGYNAQSFNALWQTAIKSAGYIQLMARLSSPEELVKAFLAEVEGDFIAEGKLESTASRKHAFEMLERMAGSDGDYSQIERVCLQALVKRLNDERNQLLASRYSRAAFYASSPEKQED